MWHGNIVLTAVFYTMILLTCGIIGVAILGLKLAQRCRENSEVLEQRDAPIRAVSVHSPSVSEELLMGKGVCRVGYALNSKKLRQSSKETTGNNNANVTRSADEKKVNIWRGGGLADILDSYHNGVTFEAFEYDAAKNAHQAFDVIIHKLTEDIDSSETDSVYKIESVNDYLRRHPETTIVDPFSAVRIVVSRASTTLKLNDLIKGSTGCPFKQPKFAIVTSPEKIKSVIQDSNLSYPVICKPIEACGTPLAHSMVVAVSEEGLSLVTCPCVIQEYIDHNGSFCKVYVIDKEVMVFQRRSLPNLTTIESRRGLDPDNTSKISSLSSTVSAVDSSKIPHSRSVAFDSRYKYPTVEDFYESALLFECSDGPKSLNMTSVLTSDIQAAPSASGCIAYSRSGAFSVTTCDEISHLAHEFAEAARVVSEGFSLTLFGFDVIIPAGCSPESHKDNLVIIDINFFPSYKEIPDFPEKLCRYMRKRAGLE